MRIIRDADVVSFHDEDGNKLFLLSAPRQRDLHACEDLERDEAVKQLQRLKDLGMDTDKILADAEAADPEELAAARAKAEDPMTDSPKIKEFRLEALARKLILDGDVLVGGKILTAYRDMDEESGRQVDEWVASVWTSATPTEAEKHREGADAGVPAVVSATP